MITTRPDARVQQTRWAFSARKWLGVLVLGAIAAAGCSSAPAPAPAVEKPRSSFADNLALTMSFGSPLVAGDKSVTASFALTNNGSAVFDGCFGPGWGVSIIVGENDAGHLVRVERPSCDEKLSLLPGQRIVWSRKVPLHNLRAGTAKVTGWVRVVNPATCNPSTGCRDASVATPLTTIAVGAR
jgi:hypothetical protein